jgi:hypothetical protein
MQEHCVWLDAMGIVLKALLLTTIVVVPFMTCTYWETKNSHDFNFLGPIVFTSFFFIVLFNFVQVHLFFSPTIDIKIVSNLRDSSSMYYD